MTSISSNTNKISLNSTTIQLKDLNNAHPGFSDSFIDHLPEPARQRLIKGGVDLSKGYPERPSEIPLFIDEAYAIRDKPNPDYIERGKNADPEKKELLKAVKTITHLTKHLGTEITGLDLNTLNDKQKDELALLVSERVVVFLRGQDLSPKKQLELGAYWGGVESHPLAQVVPGLPGVTVIWPDMLSAQNRFYKGFKDTSNGQNWHTDLVQELNSPAITHLYNDTIPAVGGDTVWASGYAAYDKLSPAFQKFLDGKTAIYRSAHKYIDREDPLNGGKYIEREFPIVRTNPATGWKHLYVNRAFIVRIVGLEPEESKTVLNYLLDVYEKNLDIQVRFTWQRSDEEIRDGKGISAIWDNRVSQHNAVHDYENGDPRHGTRVTSLGEVPYFDPNSKSQREALGLSL